MKMSASRKGKTRKPHSEETKAKISESKKGKRHSLETRRKMSLAHKTRRNKEKGIYRKSNGKTRENPQV